jgi:biopolymer transport protein ExbD
MRFRSSSNSEEQQIDISPLIDMVFILLIFFMVSTTFTKDFKLDLERPGAMSASRASSKSVRVFIDRTSQIYLDGNPVKAWMLQSRLREMFASGAEKQVLVIVDTKVPAEKLIDVVDQSRLAGAADVAVATEQEAG